MNNYQRFSSFDLWRCLVDLREEEERTITQSIDSIKLLNVSGFSSSPNQIHYPRPLLGYSISTLAMEIPSFSCTLWTDNQRTLEVGEEEEGEGEGPGMESRLTTLSLEAVLLLLRLLHVVHEPGGGGGGGDQKSMIIGGASSSTGTGFHSLLLHHL